FDGARGPRALRSFPTRRSSDLPRPREVPDGGGSPAAWFADGRDTGRFELIVGPTVEASDDPDLFLRRYTTGDSENWGRYSNPARSEEHTSELQSRFDLVCRLLL